MSDNGAIMIQSISAQSSWANKKLFEAAAQISEVQLSYAEDNTASILDLMDAIVAAQPEAVQMALDIAHAQPSALLCFEANQAECHRLSVALAIAQLVGDRCVVVHL